MGCKRARHTCANLIAAITELERIVRSTARKAGPAPALLDVKRGNERHGTTSRNCLPTVRRSPARRGKTTTSRGHRDGAQALPHLQVLRITSRAPSMPVAHQPCCVLPLEPLQMSASCEGLARKLPMHGTRHCAMRGVVQHGKLLSSLGRAAALLCVWWWRRQLDMGH